MTHTPTAPLSPSSATISRERLIGSADTGVLRIILASTPRGFVVGSERTTAPSTRTLSAPCGWHEAAARFDRLVEIAAEVTR